MAHTAAFVTEVQGSAANPYIVVKADDPRFSHCTCPAFFYRSRARGSAADLDDLYECKHLARVVVNPVAKGDSSNGITERELLDLLVNAYEDGFKNGRRGFVR